MDEAKKLDFVCPSSRSGCNLGSNLLGIHCSAIIIVVRIDEFHKILYDGVERNKNGKLHTIKK